ncbi:multiubiquitin domain-containing protein [Mesorhizobium sp. CA14]|uniref:multiubiquitin domain-containing protein n=1 Tax=Mesorhizobium sp. CA14 TaxID=2876642 RepID=UPI001CCB0AC7|nr:multiubiquitin domain-containing protein [Mesorhizobium sp. CA14]MBZ9852074.1 multiubiquitin domain-containing protein [Mesorhizobium sp. CA14]
MAKDDHPKFSINIDGVHFEATSESMTGSELKQLAGKDQQYQLFLEGHGHDADRQIGDNEGVALKNGMHFYTVPPATFG